MTKVDPYLHAVLVLHGAGKEVSADSIVSILKAAGADADAARAKVLADAVKGVDFEDLLKAAAVVAAPAAAAAPAEAAKPKEEKKDEAKTEAEAAAGLANLFG
jgi:large subunit ribosomal protein L12